MAEFAGLLFAVIIVGIIASGMAGSIVPIIGLGLVMMMFSSFLGGMKK